MTDEEMKQRARGWLIAHYGEELIHFPEKIPEAMAAFSASIQAELDRAKNEIVELKGERAVVVKSLQGIIEEQNRRLEDAEQQLAQARVTIAKMLEDVAKDVAEARAQGWVKCSERLPEAERPVLVFVGSTLCRFIAARINNEWQVIGGNGLIIQSRVTYWQPLPADPIERAAEAQREK